MIESDQLYGRLRRNPALANNSIAGYWATSDRRWEQGGVGRRIELVGEPADYRRAGRGSSYNTVGQAGPEFETRLNVLGYSIYQRAHKPQGIEIAIELVAPACRF
jgi:hypothetical protein